VGILVFPNSICAYSIRRKMLEGLPGIIDNSEGKKLGAV
jgi:hypothetical protein